MFKSQHKINIAFYQELKVIKDYIKNLKIHSNVFNQNKILQTLEIQRMQDIFLQDKRNMQDSPFKIHRNARNPRKEEEKEFKENDNEYFYNKNKIRRNLNNTKGFEDDDFQITLNKKFRSPKKQQPNYRKQRGRLSSN